MQVLNSPILQGIAIFIIVFCAFIVIGAISYGFYEKSKGERFILSDISLYLIMGSVGLFFGLFFYFM